MHHAHYTLKHWFSLCFTIFNGRMCIMMAYRGRHMNHIHQRVMETEKNEEFSQIFQVILRLRMENHCAWTLHTTKLPWNMNTHAHTTGTGKSIVKDYDGDGTRGATQFILCLLQRYNARDFRMKGGDGDGDNDDGLVARDSWGFLHFAQKPKADRYELVASSSSSSFIVVSVAFALPPSRSLHFSALNFVTSAICTHRIVRKFNVKMCRISFKLANTHTYDDDGKRYCGIVLSTKFWLMRATNNETMPFCVA